MAITSKSAPRSSERLAGDAREFARRLGSPLDPAGLACILATSGLPAVVDVPSLRVFLSTYVTSILIPEELPMVCRGFGHASRGETRELIELDRNHAPTGLPGAMLEASQMVGRAHLGRMRPLRGERRVQRYWKAVQRGDAHAWHTVVYGLVLAVYGLPLRQGLLHFGCQTIRGFLNSTCERLVIEPPQLHALEQELETPLAPAMDRLLAGSQGPNLRAL